MPTHWAVCCGVVLLAVSCERHRFYRHTDRHVPEEICNETHVNCDDSFALLQVRSVHHEGHRRLGKAASASSDYKVPGFGDIFEDKGLLLVMLLVVAAVFASSCLFWTWTKELEDLDQDNSPRSTSNVRFKRDADKIRAEFYGDVFHKAWSWKSTIAFCVSIFTMEGSLLFAVGSVFLTPGMTPSDMEHQYITRGWVDYPFMVGAWLFTLGNYFMYLQVINKDVSHDGVDEIRYISSINSKDGGHLASVLNVVGCLFYNVNTMSMFGWPPTKTNLQYDITYVSTGCLGSTCFIAAGLIQGEYNLWRRRCDAPVWVAYLNLLGGILFLIAYIAEFNHTAQSNGNTFYITWVVLPFLVGSLSFLFAAYIEILMWKRVQYGLGYARELRNSSVTQIVDTKQMAMIIIYFLNIGMALFRLCFVLAENLSFFHSMFLEIVEKVLAYHGILFCVASFHRVPDEHPYDYMIYIMRVIAVCGLVGEIEACYTILTTGRYP